MERRQSLLQAAQVLIKESESRFDEQSAELNLQKAEKEFFRMYERGEINDLGYGFIDEQIQAHGRASVKFEYTDVAYPDKVAEMDVYEYTGADVFRGGADNFLDALNTVAHEIWHLEPSNQRMWKKAERNNDLALKRSTDSMAQFRARQVVQRWKSLNCGADPC